MGGLTIAPTDSLNAARPFVRAQATVVVPAISPNGRWVAYTTDASGRFEQPQFAVTKRDTIFIDNFARGPGNEFSVFPNGQQLLMVQRAQAKAELFMVINWQQLIRLPGSSAERASTPP